MRLSNHPLALAGVFAAILCAGPVAGPLLAAENDFILRAPAGEADEIAYRNGLTIVREVSVPGDPQSQGLYRVRAAEGVPPETVIESIEELEPAVLGIEEVTLASLPELDQSTMALLDQSTMGLLDGLMNIRALSPPLGQVGPGFMGELEDRVIEGLKIKDGGRIEYHSEELVFHMLNDENRHREDVTLRADFSPGCSVEFNRAEPPLVAVPDALQFNGKKIEWEITNNTGEPISLNRVDVQWPAENLRLKKAKLNGAEIKEMNDPASVSLDFTHVEELKSRQIAPDDTERLTLEWETDISTRQMDYSITVEFAEGFTLVSRPCAVSVENDPRYDKNKLKWELFNHGWDPVTLESISIEWPEENGLITKIDFGGEPILLTETVFGKFFNGKDDEDRFVWTGYVDQPAVPILRVKEAQRESKGYSTVAIIDTGVDPGHWLLANALIPGYDFLRDEAGYASEVADLEDPSVMEILNGASAMPLDEEETFLLNQSVMGLLDSDEAEGLLAADLPPAFGHGTMVAGVVHRVAPYASIMPLRVFDANGRADLLDIVEAIYFAVDNGANVINMSFSVETFSPELMRAVNYAARKGVSCVASAGNNGREQIVYPAGLGNTIGVASTGYADELSPFSNLGSDLVTIAAPGEIIVTTYPGGGWAVASGTSFAAPWISGVAAIFADKNHVEHNPGRSDFFLASEALSHAVEVQGHGRGRAGHGRADLKQAVDKLKDGAEMGDTGTSEHPYLILVDFIEGCSVAYPPATSGSGCAAEIGSQLDVNGDKVGVILTNAGEETISLASVEITWPAEHEELKKVKLDGDEIFNQLLAAPAALIAGDWRDPDKPQKRQIPPGETLELRFEFEEDVVN